MKHKNATIYETPVNLNKIKKILAYAWENPYSSFYRDKYKKVGINPIKDINSLEDFKKLPYLTRDEIINTSPYERFFVPLEKNKGAQFSNTTTGGKGVLIMLKAMVKHPQDKIQLQKALDLKIKSAAIIMPGSAAFAINRQIFRHKSILRYMGNIHNLVSAAKVMKDLKADAFLATASVVEQLIPFLKAEKALDQIRYVSMGGEYCSRLRLDYFKKTFKNAYFRFGYNLTESDATSHACDFCNLRAENVFHPFPQYTYYEIFNPQEESELVLTNLYPKTDFPLIRYKTGDRVSIFEEKCECGRKLKMKIYGRNGMDIVKVGDNLIHREQIDAAIYPFGNKLASTAWKLMITNNGKSLPKLKLQLVVKNKTSELKSKLEKGISNNLIFQSGKTFSTLVAEKVFLPLEIDFVGDFGIMAKQKSIFVETT